MKLYYENINLDFLQIFSMLIYLVVFFFLLKFLAKKLLLKDDKFNRYYFIGILSMYFALLVGDVIFDYIPFFPDTKTYYGLLKDFTKGHSNIEVNIGFGVFSRPIYILSFKNTLIYILFNAVINQIGVLSIWKAFRIYKDDKLTIRNQRLYLIASAIYPVSILYSLTLLRESYFIFAFSIFLIGLMNKKKVNIPIVLGSMLVIVFRTKYILFCAAAYFLKIIFYNESFIKIKIAAVTLLSPILFQIANFISIKATRISIKPIYLQNFRNSRRNSYLSTGMAYPRVSWGNWFDVLQDFPGLIAQFLFSPLPILISYDFLNSIAYTIDAIYVILVLLLFLINLRNNYKNVFWIVVILTLIVLSSMFEYFLTGAVRHRYIIILMFLPLLFSDKKENVDGNRSFNVFGKQKKTNTIDFTGKKYKF